MGCQASDSSEEDQHAGDYDVLESLQTIRTQCALITGLAADVASLERVPLSSTSELVEEQPPAAHLLAGSSGIAGPVEAGHCFARMRGFVPSVLKEAATKLAAIPCDLEDVDQARRSGVLLVRGALSEDTLRSAVALYQKELTNATGTVRAAPFLGRTSWRGIGLSEPARSTLNSLLSEWSRLGLLPPISAPARALGIPRVSDQEYMALDAAKQAAECPYAAWHLCISIWHRDGSESSGVYKQWALLSRREDLAVDPAVLESLGVDAASSAREHSNIVVAPLDRVEALCELAAGLNRTMAPPPRGQSAPSGSGLEKGDESVDADGAERLEAVSRSRDRAALEAASCAVTADPGDVLLLHPAVFHRTQDALVDRVALIAEVAFASV